MTIPNPEPRQAQRRRLLLRYIHHVERTGLALYPALEQHLCTFLAPPTVAVVPPPASETTPALPPPKPTAAASAAPVVTVNNLITSAAPASPPVLKPPREMVRTVDTFAVDAELADLQRQAADGLEASLAPAPAAPKPAPGATPAPAPRPPDPARQALKRAVQEIRRTGVCDHPALEARLDSFLASPAIERGDPAVALNATVAASRRLLLRLQDQLLPSVDQPTGEPLGLPGIVLQLRSCRRSLADLLSSFGAELRAPLRAIMRRQLRRARRLDWRLRWELLRCSEDRIRTLTSLALAAVGTLQNVVALWPAVGSWSFAGEMAPQTRS